VKANKSASSTSMGQLRVDKHLAVVTGMMWTDVS
jgi:hypothetical protein